MAGTLTGFKADPLLRRTIEQAAEVSGISLSDLLRRGAAEVATRLLLEHTLNTFTALTEPTDE